MKINEITTLFERLEQSAVDQVATSLKYNPDPEAQLTYFHLQRERGNPAHTSVDSAQQAAEIRAKQDIRKIEKAQKEPPEKQMKLKNDTEVKQYSNNFRGNQYVTVARKQLPTELKAWLPIIDGANPEEFFKGNWNIGSNLASLGGQTIKKQSKLGEPLRLSSSKDYKDSPL